MPCQIRITKMRFIQSLARIRPSLPSQEEAVRLAEESADHEVAVLLCELEVAAFPNLLCLQMTVVIMPILRNDSDRCL